MSFTHRFFQTAAAFALSTALSAVAFAEPAALSEAPDEAPAQATDASETPAPTYDFNRIKKTRDLDLKVGQKALINLGAVRHYGVQDDQVVRLASHPDGDKIVVIAKAPGLTTVGVGRIGFQVTVK